MSFANFLSVFLIFLPAFLANASPVIAKNIPGIRHFSRPINAQIFGKNKTIRGFLTGVMTGALSGIALYFCRYIFINLLPNYTTLYNLYSSIWKALFIGWLLGTGAMLGDVVKSFIKRRLGKKPGVMFQPWDGIDYMIGAMTIIYPWYSVSLSGGIFLLIIWPLLSLAMNTLAYQIGWKECWY